MTGLDYKITDDFDAVVFSPHAEPVRLGAGEIGLMIALLTAYRAVMRINTPHPTEPGTVTGFLPNPELRAYPASREGWRIAFLHPGLSWQGILLDEGGAQYLRDALRVTIQ